VHLVPLGLVDRFMPLAATRAKRQVFDSRRECLDSLYVWAGLDGRDFLDYSESWTRSNFIVPRWGQREGRSSQ